MTSTSTAAMTGDQFRAVRERLGFSRKQLAERMAVNWRTVEGWEQGHTVISSMAKRLLADPPVAPPPSQGRVMRQASAVDKERTYSASPSLRSRYSAPPD